MVTEDGRIRISARGGFESRWMIGQRVRILCRAGSWIDGFVCGRSAHGVPAKDRDKPIPPVEELEVYVGAENREDVESLGAHPGAPVTFAGQIEPLNPDYFPGVVAGPSMDDLCAVVAMLGFMDRTWRALTRSTLHFVATTREEMGGLGAVAAARRLEPTHVLALDIGVVESAPEAIPTGVKLGGGPVVVWQDSSGRNVYDYDSCNELVDCAREVGLPVQEAVFQFYGSDASHVQSALGVPANLVAIPTMFSHNVPEVVDLRDVECCERLVARWLEKRWA
ncbi:MAG: M42 family metallopeptidase [Promethearchaeota archaeon]